MEVWVSENVGYKLDSLVITFEEKWKMNPNQKLQLLEDRDIIFVTFNGDVFEVGKFHVIDFFGLLSE